MLILSASCWQATLAPHDLNMDASPLENLTVKPASRDVMVFGNNYDCSDPPSQDITTEGSVNFSVEVILPIIFINVHLPSFD